MGHLRKKQYILPLTSLCFLLLAIPSVASAEMSFAQQLFFGLVATVTGWFLGIGGLILDWGINVFLIGFGDLYNTSGVGRAVDSMWVIIRDFVNMTFIFGLVYIGFKLILDSNDSQTKRWLARLIIAALLINFSLFITKAVIEVSNQFAIKIIESGFEMQDGEVDMAASLQDKLGITTVFTIADSSSYPASIDEGNAWGYIFGVGILFLVTGFVYAAGGILLIIRFAILNFYMVLSPVLFLGWILPPLAGSIDKYWKSFLSRAFVAPIYILMLYFSFRILDGLKEGGRIAGNGDWTSSFAGSGPDIIENSQTTIPFFIMTIFFMIGSIVIAQRLGAEGANKAVSVGKNWSNAAGRRIRSGAGAATFGTAAAVGRNTAGRYAYNQANSDSLKAEAARSMRGRLKLRAAEKIGGASFDARAVGGLGKATGIGTAAKGGFAKMAENREKAAEKFAKDLGTTDINKPENKTRVDNEVEVVKDELTKELEEKREELSVVEENLEGVRELEQELAQVKEMEAAFRKNGMAEDADKEAAKKAEIQSRLSGFDSGMMEKRKTLAYAIGDIEKELGSEENIQNEAKARIKYENQIAYLKSLENGQKFAKPVAGGAAAATLGAAAMIGFPLTGAAYATAAAVNSNNSLNKQIEIDKLKKDYGKNVRKKLSKDEKKKNLEELKGLVNSDKNDSSASSEGKDDSSNT